MRAAGAPKIPKVRGKAFCKRQLRSADACKWRSMRFSDLSIPQPPSICMNWDRQPSKPSMKTKSLGDRVSWPLAQARHQHPKSTFRLHSIPADRAASGSSADHSISIGKLQPASSLCFGMLQVLFGALELWLA